MEISLSQPSLRLLISTEMTANYNFITVIVIVTMLLLHSPADRRGDGPPILLNVKEKFIVPGAICPDEKISLSLQSMVKEMRDLYHNKSSAMKTF